MKAVVTIFVFLSVLFVSQAALSDDTLAYKQYCQATGTVYGNAARMYLRGVDGQDFYYSVHDEVVNNFSYLNESDDFYRNQAQEAVSWFRGRSYTQIRAVHVFMGVGTYIYNECTDQFEQYRKDHPR